MISCPYCHREEKQVKAGKNASGSQRYKCQHCERRYTPEPEEMGYPDEVRQQALRFYIDGVNFRRIARHLGVSQVTIMNWVKAAANRLPETPPQPTRVEVIEEDELFTFIGDKKTSFIS